MNTVFVLTSSTHINALREARFFSTKEKACQALKEKRDATCHKLGVDVIEDNETRFSYLFGWEEHKVTFSVVEIEIE